MFVTLANSPLVSSKCVFLTVNAAPLVIFVKLLLDLLEYQQFQFHHIDFQI